MATGEIMKWATEEMGYQPVKDPQIEQMLLKKLCPPDLMPVWTHMIQHIRSRRTTQKIRENLKLHRQQLDQQHHSEDLHKQITLQKECAQAEREVLDKFGLIGRKEAYAQQVTDGIAESERQKMLVKLFGQETEKLVRAYHDLHERLDNIKNKLQARSSSPAFVFHKDTRDASVLLEPESVKAVRRGCDSIASNKIDLVEQASGSEWDSDLRSLLQDSHWLESEKISSKFRPEEILSALVAYAKETTDSVAEQTRQISLKEDAQRLKFTFEPGGLKDISPGRPLLRTVAELIEDRQNDHFMRFIRSEDNRNKILEMDGKIQEKVEQLECIIQEKRSLSKDGPLHFKEWAKKKIELSGMKASAGYIREVIAQLNDLAKTKQESLQMMYGKYKRIQKFESLMASKQLVIQSLVKYNSNARGSLNGHNKEILDFVQTNVVTNVERISEIIDRNIGISGQELELFRTLPLSRLDTVILTSGCRQPSQKLCIHRIRHASHLPGGETLFSILKLFNVYSCSSPDALFEKILADRIKAFDSLEDDCQRNKLIEETGALTAKLGQDVEVDVIQAGKSKIGVALAALGASLEKISSAEEDMANLKNLINVWWEQPAQHLTPWVTVDGSNLDVWLTKWKAKAEEIRQKETLS